MRRTRPRFQAIMEEEKNPLLYLVLLLLFMSCIIPLSTGSSASEEKIPVQLDDQVASRDVHVMWEHSGRKDIEVNDYPGSGANNRHDPKSPGTRR